MAKVFIYVLVHPVTNEIRYVGLTRVPAKRLNNEINYPHTRHFANWVNSILEIGLRPIMEVIEETEEGLACDKEREWIEKMKIIGCRLLNFTTGGEGGFRMSDECRAANSVRQKGKILGPMSEEHKAKISAANKGRRFNPKSGINFAALNISRRGIPLKEETKNKLSVIGKNRLKGEWFEKFMDGNRNRKRQSKFTDQQKGEIKYLLAEGYSHKIISDRYGLTIGTLSCIKRGEMWVDITPTSIQFLLPEHKRVPLFRNDKGQYERVRAA